MIPLKAKEPIYSVEQRKVQKIKKILIVTFSIAIVVTLLFGLLRLLSERESIQLQTSFPGRAIDGMETSSNEKSNHLKIGLNDKLMVNGLLRMYAKVPGDTIKKNLVLSEISLFADQVELLSFYAEIGDKRKFKTLFQLVDTKFKETDGLYKAQIDTIDESSLISISENIRYCRVLLEGYSRFKSTSYLRSARVLSDRLFPLCSKYGIPPAETRMVVDPIPPTPDFSATPTPKPTAEPSIDIESVVYTDVIDLSTVDLYALKLLSSLDTRWTYIYSNSLAIVKGALIDHPAPLFQAGYYPDSKGYTPYLESAPEFNFEHQILIALHLAEVGELGDSTYSYLSQQLMNSRAFYRSYDMLTSKAVSSTESIIGYSCMARIARMGNDSTTYAFCTDRIYWNSADSNTSKIFGLTFYETEDKTIWATARDAVFALKALY